MEKCPHCNKNLEIEYKELTFEDKKYRIYKWEDKHIGDFLKKLPKGFRLIEHSEWVELFDNKIIDYPEDWEVYWTKHYSKRKQKEKILSRFFLNSNSYLLSLNVNLADSYSDGRVVLVKQINKVRSISNGK